MIALALGVAVIAVYLCGVYLYDRRFPGRAFSLARVCSFIIGTSLLTAVMLPPADSAAESSFFAHMAQHIVIWLVAPPFILLGAPMLLIVAVPRQEIARRFTAFADSRGGRLLFAPLTAWLSFVFVMWGAHFSPLYDLALRFPPLHVAEHVLFLVTGLLFWAVVVQVGYAPRPLSYPVRMFYLFFSIPQGAFLGFALNASQHVLYPQYASRFGSSALALTDQHNGADLLWIFGGVILFTAFMCTAGVWAATERGAAVAS